MTVFVLALASAVMFAFVLIAARLSGRNWQAAVYGIAFIVLYLLDALASYGSGAITLSPTLSNIPAPGWATSRVVVFACLTLVVALVTMIVATGRAAASTPERPAPGAPYDQLAFLPLLPLLFIGPFFLKTVASGSLSAYLANRQLYLNNSLPTTISYYLVPVAGVYSYYGLRRAQNVAPRAYYLVLLVIYVALSFLTGSRTTALLGVVAPVVHHLLASASRDGKVRAGRLVAGAAAAVLLYLISSAYITHYRGSAEVESGFFNSQDVSMYDASVAIVANDVRDPSTYLASAVFALPRTIWAHKPVSGNVVASQALYPSRYALTKSEVAASLVGEGYIVAGNWCFLTAGLLFGLWMTAAGRIHRFFLRADRMAVVFSYLFFYRGFNLIRGDLLNFIVPTVLSGVFLWVGLRRHVPRPHPAGARPAGARPNTAGARPAVSRPASSAARRTERPPRRAASSGVTSPARAERE